MTLPWPFDETSPFFSGPSLSNAERWIVETWWIETTHKTYQLLYGWCIQRSGEPPQEQWVSSSEDKKIQGNKGKRSIKCLRLDAYGGHIYQFVSHLSEGKTFLESAKLTGIKSPPIGFENFSFSSSENPIQKLFIKSPWIFCHTAKAVKMRSISSLPRSPNFEAPCLVRSLLRKNLKELFSVEEKFDRQLFNSSVDLMKNETGLDFRHAYFSHFGSFDVLLFPSAFPNENSRVDVVHKGDGVVSVSVDLTGLENLESMIVRCSQEYSGAVLSDEVKVISVQQVKTINCDFRGPSNGPYATLVECWLKTLDPNANHKLFFADTIHIIKKFVVSIDFIQMEANIKCPWLEKFTNAKETKLRAEKISRPIYSVPIAQSEIGEKATAFEEVTMEREKLQKQLFPEQTETKFFPPTHPAPIDQSGKLPVAEWFSTLAKGADAGDQIIILDPYIDSWGVSLLVRAERTNIKYKIFTYFQNRKDKGEDAKRRINKFVAELNLIFCLKDIRIVELYSFFHDRYVLIENAGGVIKKGFNLSNSLQSNPSSPEKDFPLLITSIGGDVLEKVSDYVKSLIKENKCSEIYPAEISKKNILQPQEGPNFKPESLDDVEKRLLNSEENEFSALWSDYSETLSSIHNADERLKLFETEQGKFLVSSLVIFIQKAPFINKPYGSLGTVPDKKAIALLQSVLRPVHDLIHDWKGSRFGDHSVGLLVPNSIQLAAKILALYFPDELVKCIDSIVCSSSKTGKSLVEQTPFANIFYCLFASIINKILFSPTPILESRILQAETPLLRVLGGFALGERYLKKLPIFNNQDLNTLNYDQSLFDNLNLLKDTKEKIFILSLWVSSIRVSANSAEILALAEARKTIFERMKMIWPEGLQEEDLKTIISLLSKSIEDSWIETMLNDLLIPISNSGRMDISLVEKVFIDIFADEIYLDFSCHIHVNLTETVANLVSSSKQDGQKLDVLLSRIKSAAKKAKRGLGRPFLRSTDRTAWAHSKNILIWVGTLGRLIQIYGNCQIEIKELVTDWINASDDFLGIDKDSDPSGLLAFAKEVQLRYKSKKNLNFF